MVEYEVFSFSLNKSLDMSVCKDSKIDMAYWISLNGERSCIVYSEDPTINAVCKAETGTDSDQYGRYLYPGKI